MAKSDTNKTTPDKTASQSPEKRLDDLIGAFVGAAEAKGWGWEIAAKDAKNFRYATVSVWRNQGRDVSATFEITCDDGAKLSGHGTSFYSDGVSDLRDAAWNEIAKLPWLEKPRTKTAENSDWHSEVISRLLRRFHRVAHQLKHRHDDREPYIFEDEYDIQDLLQAVLRGLFDDVRAEEYTPSYAGGASRVDFLLKKERIVIEAKMASPRLRDKQIGEQLIVDIARYRTHPDCNRLICFVYDPTNNLKNPGGLEADLSGKHGALGVTVIVVSPS